MSNLSSAFNYIDALTEQQRDHAYANARQRIAGRKPVYEDFHANAYSEWPTWFLQLATGLGCIMLLAAFLPSAMRLHAVAFATNASIMQDVPSLYWAALATVVMAEIGQVIFSIVAVASAKRWFRVALWIGAWICTLVALSGNAAAFGMHAFDSPFAFLEAFAPPVLVLLTAQVLKTQALNAIAGRKAAHNAFTVALAEWEMQYANAPQHASWERTLANALRYALRERNKAKKAKLRELQSADWVALVMRERKSEEWWDRAVEMQERKPSRSQTAYSGQTTNAINNATVQSQDAFVSTCEECGTEFEGQTERQAKNKLAAHSRVHKREREIAMQNGNAAYAE